jgi:hypothetical protein
LARARVSKAPRFAGLVILGRRAEIGLGGVVRAEVGEGARFQRPRFAGLVTLGRRAEIGLGGAVRAEVGEGARFQDRQISLVCQIWGARAGVVNGRIVLVAYAMEGLS